METAYQFILIGIVCALVVALSLVGFIRTER